MLASNPTAGTVEHQYHQPAPFNTEAFCNTVNNLLDTPHGQNSIGSMCNGEGASSPSSAAASPTSRAEFDNFIQVLDPGFQHLVSPLVDTLVLVTNPSAYIRSQQHHTSAADPSAQADNESCSGSSSSNSMSPNTQTLPAQILSVSTDAVKVLIAVPPATTTVDGQTDGDGANTKQVECQVPWSALEPIPNSDVLNQLVALLPSTQAPPADVQILLSAKNLASILHLAKNSNTDVPSIETMKTAVQQASALYSRFMADASPDSHNSTQSPEQAGYTAQQVGKSTNAPAGQTASNYDQAKQESTESAPATAGQALNYATNIESAESHDAAADLHDNTKLTSPTQPKPDPSEMEYQHTQGVKYEDLSQLAQQRLYEQEQAISQGLQYQQGQQVQPTQFAEQYHLHADVQLQTDGLQAPSAMLQDQSQLYTHALSQAQGAVGSMAQPPALLTQSASTHQTKAPPFSVIVAACIAALSGQPQPLQQLLELYGTPVLLPLPAKIVSALVASSAGTAAAALTYGARFRDPRPNSLMPIHHEAQQAYSYHAYQQAAAAAAAAAAATPTSELSGPSYANAGEVSAEHFTYNHAALEASDNRLIDDGSYGMIGEGSVNPGSRLDEVHLHTNDVVASYSSHDPNVSHASHAYPMPTSHDVGNATPPSTATPTAPYPQPKRTSARAAAAAANAQLQSRLASESRHMSHRSPYGYGMGNYGMHSGGLTSPSSSTNKKNDVIDRTVLVTSGKHRGKQGIVKSSGHGFYCISINGEADIMKRATEFEVLGDPEDTHMMAPGAGNPFGYGPSPSLYLRPPSSAASSFDMKRPTPVPASSSSFGSLSFSTTNSVGSGPNAGSFGRVGYPSAPIPPPMGYGAAQPQYAYPGALATATSPAAAIPAQIPPPVTTAASGGSNGDSSSPTANTAQPYRKRPYVRRNAAAAAAAAANAGTSAAAHEAMTPSGISPVPPLGRALSNESNAAVRASESQSSVDRLVGIDQEGIGSGSQAASHVEQLLLEQQLNGEGTTKRTKFE